MDSLTQLTLGAAVAEATIGKKVGRKASLWGAILGTFPDLDVFIPMGHAVDNFTYHRSFSHSIIVLSILAPFFVWLVCKIHPNDKVHRNKWYISVYLVLITHVLLDAFTVYGTQLFWPITEYPVSIGSIFIVDPSYTLPMLLSVLLLLIFRGRSFAYKLNSVAILFSSAYLFWSLGVQQYLSSQVHRQLQKNSVKYSQVLTQPTPINTILWRIVVMTDKGYLVGYRSLLDESDEVSFREYPSQPELLKGIENHPPVKRLQWFSHGFYSVNDQDGKVVISDLRMGIEPQNYVFRFAVGNIGESGVEPIVPVRVKNNRGFETASRILKRIVDETTPMTW